MSKVCCSWKAEGTQGCMYVTLLYGCCGQDHIQCSESYYLSWQTKAVRQETPVSATLVVGTETSQRAVYTAHVAVQLPSIRISSVTGQGGLTGPRLALVGGPWMPAWWTEAKGCPVYV